jgi:hypothetical protein
MMMLGKALETGLTTNLLENFLRAIGRFDDGLVGQVVVALVFLVLGIVLFWYQQRPTVPSKSIAEAADDTVLVTSGLHVDSTPLVSEATGSPPVQQVHYPPHAEQTLSHKLTNALDIDAFLRKLREEGLSVIRMKNKKPSFKRLRLNDKGDIYWAKTWFPKYIPLNKLMNVIDPLDSNGGFILEFMSSPKPILLNLRVPEHEFPFDTLTVANYFKAVQKILKRDSRYISRFLKEESISKPFVEDDMADAKSDVSEITENTYTPTGSRPNTFNTVTPLKPSTPVQQTRQHE